MTIIAILLILLIGGGLTLLVRDKWAKYVALAVSVFTFLSSVCLLVTYSLGKNQDVLIPWLEFPQSYLTFTIDGLSLPLILLTTVLSPIIILTSWDKDVRRPNLLYSLILFMEWAMLGTFASGDGLVYYIFWELSLLPIYFIILLWGNGEFEKRRRTVVTFFIYTFAGSLFMLVSMVYLYSLSGSFLLSRWYELSLPSAAQYWVFGGFFLAYAIKVPLIPFHSWQASTYQKAPAYGTMLLSGIMLKMGLYSIIRWQIPVAPLAADTFKWLLVGISLAGVIYGSLITLKQRNIKKFLAYSSLAHVGLIAAGAYTLTEDGLLGAVVQMLSHGLVIVGLFYIADIIYSRLGTANIDEMGGIKIHAGKLSTAFIILVLTSISLPLTFSFIGEFTILYSLFQTNLWYAVVGGLTIILGAFYMLRMFQQVMLGETGTRGFTDLKPMEIFVLVLIIFPILFFGIYPQPILEMIRPAVLNVLSVIPQ